MVTPWNLKKDVSRVHMIGVGGIGMSALARFFLHEGMVVSGSDRESSQITDTLRSEGVQVFEKHDKDNIPDDIQLAVYTEAIPEDNEELLSVRSRGVPTLSYSNALGAMVNDYYLIAVSGAHGKTTTTAMLADIMEQAGMDPTVIVGSLRKNGSNFRHGKSKYALVEACEYKDSFHRLQPDLLIITNIEHEHVNYFENLEAVQKSFSKMTAKLFASGVVVADVADPNVKPVLEGLQATVVDYRPFIDTELILRVPGLHNRLNAACATAAANVLEIESEVTKNALENFSGTSRRFEYKGNCFLKNKGGYVPVYDDYAHHPSEVMATIAGARELYPDRQVMVVFQPHTYSRTSVLRHDLVKALSKADTVFLAPIYEARKETAGKYDITSETIATDLKDVGVRVEFRPTLDALVSLVRETAGTDDLVLVMGAGDINKVADILTI